MGVVDFDPEKWSRANACDSPADVAKVAKLAEVGPDLAALSQLSQLSQLAPLPIHIRDGLATLGRMKAPRDLNSTRWPIAVTDAVRLGGDGWAAKALALGWSDLVLFGVVAAHDGDPNADGLAVKLSGRRLLAICGTFATIDPGAGGRLYLYRGNNDGARLLWACRGR